MTRDQIGTATRELVEALPEDASWDDVMYGVYVRQKIEEGLADSEAGRVVTVEDIRAHFQARR